jgi:hypothetical protein
MKGSHLQNDITPHETTTIIIFNPQKSSQISPFFLHFQLLVATNLRSSVEQLVVVVVAN